MSSDPTYMRELGNQLIRRIMTGEVPAEKRGTSWRAAHILYDMAALRDAHVPMDVVLSLSEYSVVGADQREVRARNLALYELGMSLDR